MTTLSDIQDYYENLLILQYKSQPRAKSTIGLLVDIASMDLLPSELRDSFNIDNATGAQLDIIGKYAGMKRSDYSILGTDDETYRGLIKFGILRNNANSDLGSIQTLMEAFFGAGNFIVFDYMTMRMGYVIRSGIVSEQVIRLAIKYDLMLKPMGVALGATIFMEDFDLLFGMRTYSSPLSSIHGFNTYASYDDPSPWLQYSNTITNEV